MLLIMRNIKAIPFSVFRIADGGSLQCSPSSNGNSWIDISDVEGITFIYKEAITVNYYINGQLAYTQNAQKGDSPLYRGSTPSRDLGNGSNVSFVGWATEPNSKEYSDINDLPVITESVDYYAIFTAPTYFYFVLPGCSNTSSDASDYMYAGDGVVIVPDDFTGNGTRWYSPEYPLDSYLVEGPTDAEVRKGLETYYDGRNGKEKYQSSWEYTIDWVTLTVGNTSVGYNYETINSGYSVHLDCSLQLQTEEKVTALYNIVMPDNQTIIQSKQHKKNSIIEINSTVSETESFYTDGYLYNAVMEGDDGTSYIFDGWYIDSDYNQKAEETVNLGESSQTFYARYIPIEEKYGLVGYNLALAGAEWKNGTPDGLEYSRDTSEGGKVYTEKSRYDTGDTFEVRADKPEAENYAFIGWFDKDRTETSGGDIAQFREAGENLTYIYDGSEESADTYTLDAVWASLSAAGGEYTYDGSAKYITADSEYTTQLDDKYIEEIEQGSLVDFGEFQYRWSADNGDSWTDWANENPGFINAGSYRVQVKQTINGTEITAETTLTIAKRPVTITVADNGKIYGESDPTFSDALMSGQVEGELGDVDLSVIRSNDDENVGTYPDVLNIIKTKGDLESTYTNYNFIINPGDFVISKDKAGNIEKSVTITSWTYDGQAAGSENHAVTSSATSENDGVKAEYTYYVKNGEEWNALDEAPVNVGSYKVVANWAETTNYPALSAECEFTISKAPLTVTTPSASKAYDGTPLTAEGTIEGLVNNETVGFITTGSQTEVGSSTNTYTIVWAADDNEFTAQESNYTINENLGTLEVTEAPAQDTSEGTTGNTDNNGTDQDNSSSLVKTSDMVMPGVVIGIVLIAAACVAFAAYKSRRPRGRHSK